MNLKCKKQAMVKSQDYTRRLKEFVIAKVVGYGSQYAVTVWKSSTIMQLKSQILKHTKREI